MMPGTPATPSSKVRRTPCSTPGGSKVSEEKILVTVRLRPLNRREQALYDLIAWDCLDEHTIVFKNPNHERPSNPYTFDKVFGPMCSTQKVYEEGAKDVALSALTGMNGTIVDKPQEEIVQNGEHLRHLIGICEAQRQVGETSLNDKSSRSHQIIRLTIESSLRESSGSMKAFGASLNLVDLAGSERASQTNADGTRLKEGSHINRSLLTLTTVIRKLSPCSAVVSKKEKYVFGINVENSCVKEVARLEAELRSPKPSYLRSILEEKDLKIQQMEREMEELKRERDLAQSLLESERKAKKVQKGSEQCGPSGQVARCLSFPGENEIVPSHSRDNPVTPRSRTRGANRRKAMVRRSVTSTDPSMLVNEIRKLEQRQKQLGDEANRALEVLHKEVASHQLGNKETAETIAKLLSEIKEIQAVRSISEESVTGDGANLKDEISRWQTQAEDIKSLERKLENVQKSIDQLVISFSNSVEIPECKAPSKKKKILPFNLSNSPNMQHLIRSPCSPLNPSRRVMEYETENKVPENNNAMPSDETAAGRYKVTPPKSDENGARKSSKEGSPGVQHSNTVNVKKMERMFKNAAEENIRSIKSYVTELKERVTKLSYQKHLLLCQVIALEKDQDAVIDEMDNIDESLPGTWELTFEEDRKEIIMLWHLCHVSIIHRTQFYLLFKGEPSDQIYMEVELRRLQWLEQHFSDLGNASPALLGDEPAGSVAASIKALKQEREYLAKRVSSKLTAEEREMLYAKWEIPPGGKQRRLQLVNKLWTDPHNMQNVQESAEIVAKLVGFCESGEHISKEMFELNFAHPSDKKTWIGWNLISNLLNL
ncbi:hypothetical protein C1H46_041641 [Malus baccata]|uniref:Kinesin-like protein n=1 Tax=Malus baccata TaxID=106549 RepID=A0A540KF11_MALBA|nr:hypothetical protein C1H46_041641 [Malus baccata]